MHPILGKGGRLGLFLVAWVVTATLFLFVALDPGEVSFTRWTLFIVPLAVLHAFFSLAAWFPCRVTPLRSSTSLRILSSHVLGAVVAHVRKMAVTRLIVHGP